MFRTTLLALSFILLATPGFAGKKASKPQLVSQHKDWSVYKLEQGKDKIFYALSYPKRSQGKYTKRGDVYILITNWPKRSSYNVVSFHAGYPFKNGATVQVTVDKKNFTAFAAGETCWFPDDTDKEVTTAFAKGRQIVVKGCSARGTKTVDTFSLAGSSAALKSLNRISKRG